jgi:hypothetical protein
MLLIGFAGVGFLAYRRKNKMMQGQSAYYSTFGKAAFGRSFYLGCEIDS